MKTYWLIRMGDELYIGMLGVAVEQRRKAYRFRTSAHADRMQKLTAEAFTGLNVRVVGPFTEGKA